MKRTKKPPLTPEQLQLEKDVKRINERINEIAKKYGTDSYTYNKWYSAVKAVIPERFRKTSQHGVIQISRSREFYDTYKSERTKSAITRLLGTKTRGQLRKEAKEGLRVSGITKPTPVQIAQREIMVDKVNSFVESNQDMFYVEDAQLQKLTHIRGRKKTYEELNEIINIYQERVQGNATIIYKDIFEGL